MKKLKSWNTEIRALHADPFITLGVDIESHLLSANHLATINDVTPQVAQDVIDRALEASRDQSIRKFINGRCDIEKKRGTYGHLDIGQLSISAHQLYDENSFRYCHSKTVMARARELFRAEQGRNLVSAVQSTYINSPTLNTISRRVFRERLG